MNNNLPSASSLYRDANCAANRTMAEHAEELGMLPPAWTEFTERGSRVHAGNPENLDEQDAYTTCSRRLWDEVSSQVNDDEQRQLIVKKEHRLYLRNGLVPYFTGQPDIIYRYDRQIFFGDLKPGFETDWEAWAAQMQAYSCLIYENLWHPGIDRITGIISTRFYGLKIFNYQIDKIPEAIEAIKEIVSRLNNKDAIPTPGPWCRYCKARLICKESLSQPLAVYDQPVEQLPSGPEGALIVEKLKLIVKIAKDRLDYYETKMKDDPAFLGGLWALGTRKTRTVTDTEAAVKTLLESRLLTQKAIWPCIKLSLQQAQNKIRETNPGMTVKAAKDALVDTLCNLLVIQESEPFLVRTKEEE